MEKAIYRNVIVPNGIITTSTEVPFETTNLDMYLGNVSGAVSVFIKAVPTSALAATTYTYPSNMADGVLFNIPFNTDNETTANDLADAINNEAANSASPLFGLMSVNSNGGGAYDIEANVPYIKIEITCIAGITAELKSFGFDMATDDKKYRLTANVSTGSFVYKEDPYQPLQHINGLKVIMGGCFKIEGRENIINARVMQLVSTASLAYQIYREV